MRQLHSLAARRRKPAAAESTPISRAPTLATAASAELSAVARPAMREMVDALEADILVAIDAVAQTIGATSAVAAAASDDLAILDEAAKDLAAAGDGAQASLSDLTASSAGLLSISTEIGAAMDATTRKVRDAVNCARSASGLTADLIKATEEIVGIIDTISSVARQTNLLALHATIEAARAGPAGQGFARVASDVKSLSVETSKAAEDIRARIGRLRDRTGSSTRAVEKVASLVQELEPGLRTIHGAIDAQRASTLELGERSTNLSGHIGRMRESAREMRRAKQDGAVRVAQAVEASAGAEVLACSLSERVVTMLRRHATGNRRRHERYPIQLKATLDVGAHTLVTHTVDLSVGGVLLANQHEVALSAGYPIEMEIERLGRVPARVVAISHVGLHCAFSALDLGTERRLAQVLVDLARETDRLT